MLRPQGKGDLPVPPPPHPARRSRCHIAPRGGYPHLPRPPSAHSAPAMAEVGAFVPGGLGSLAMVCHRLTSVLHLELPSLLPPLSMQIACILHIDCIPPTAYMPLVTKHTLIGDRVRSLQQGDRQNRRCAPRPEARSSRRRRTHSTAQPSPAHLMILYGGVRASKVVLNGRFDPQTDLATGFRTRAMMAVPVRNAALALPLWPRYACARVSAVGHLFR